MTSDGTARLYDADEPTSVQKRLRPTRGSEVNLGSGAPPVLFSHRVGGGEPVNCEALRSRVQPTGCSPGEHPAPLSASPRARGGTQLALAGGDFPVGSAPARRERRGRQHRVENVRLSPRAREGAPLVAGRHPVPHRQSARGGAARRTHPQPAARGRSAEHRPLGKLRVRSASARGEAPLVVRRHPVPHRQPARGEAAQRTHPARSSQPPRVGDGLPHAPTLGSARRARSQECRRAPPAWCPAGGTATAPPARHRPDGVAPHVNAAPLPGTGAVPGAGRPSGPEPPRNALASLGSSAERHHTPRPSPPHSPGHCLKMPRTRRRPTPQISPPYAPLRPPP
ncbi:hypothetical protein a10_05365 [Streptomyces acidiscabies]|nr:hypothetical protein a10_05365 [Streptomyces acidiscabies]